MHTSKAIFAAVFACLIGFGLGYFSLISGAHGGSPLATILFSAPTYFVLFLTVGDTPAYAYGMILGTGIQCSAYAFVAVNYPRGGWLLVVVTHAFCAGLLAALCFYNNL